MFEAPKPVVLAKPVPTPRTAPQQPAALHRAAAPPSASFTATPARSVRTSLGGSLAPFRGLPGGGRLSVPPPPVFTPSARPAGSPGAAVGPTGTPVLAAAMAPPRRSVPLAPPQAAPPAAVLPPAAVESQRGESDAPVAVATSDATQPLGDDLDGGWAPAPADDVSAPAAAAAIAAAAPLAVVTATPPVSEEEPSGMGGAHAAVASDAALAAAAGASSDSDDDVAPHLVAGAPPPAATAQPRQRRSAVAAEPAATQAVDAAVEGDDDESDVEPEEAAAAGGASAPGGQGGRMTRAKGVLPTNFNYVSLDPYWQRTYTNAGRPLPPPEAMVTAQPRTAAEVPKQKRGGAAAKPAGAGGKKKAAAAVPAAEPAPAVSTRRAAGLPASNDVNFFLALDPHWSRVYEKLGGLPEAPPPKPKKKSPGAAAKQAAAKKAAPKKKRDDADVDFFVLSDPYWRRVYEKLGLVDAQGNRIIRDGSAPAAPAPAAEVTAAAAAPKRSAAKKRGAAAGGGDSRAAKKKSSAAAAAAAADVPMDGDVHDEQMYDDGEQEGGAEEEADMPAADQENVGAEEEDAPMLATQAAPCTQAPAARVAVPGGVSGAATQGVSAAAAALNDSDVFADPATLGMAGGYVYGYDTTADVQFFTAGGAMGLNFL